MRGPRVDLFRVSQKLARATCLAGRPAAAQGEAGRQCGRGQEPHDGLGVRRPGGGGWPQARIGRSQSSRAACRSDVTAGAAAGDEEDEKAR